MSYFYLSGYSDNKKAALIKSSFFTIYTKPVLF